MGKVLKSFRKRRENRKSKNKCIILIFGIKIFSDRYRYGFLVISAIIIEFHISGPVRVC